MRILPDRAIFGHQRGFVLAGGGNDDLVRRISGERLRQTAAFDQYRTCEFRKVQARLSRCLIKPLVEGPVEHELRLLYFLGELPYGDQRKPERVRVLTVGDRSPRLLRESPISGDPPIHACVSRTIRIPLFASAERVSVFAQHASGETTPGHLRSNGNELRHGPPAFGDDDRRLRPGDVVQRLEADVFELSGCDRFHARNIAMAIMAMSING